jgi:hypothetical protein
MIWRADDRELKTLRHSLRRVAEAAEARGAPLIIPPYGAERGWNTLCLNLIEWMGDRRVNLDGSDAGPAVDRQPDGAAGSRPNPSMRT